jgi:hypothetical protein
MASTSSSLTLAMYDYNSPAMMKSSNSQSPAMRLSALVDLQTQPLKRIFPPSHPKLSVQFQFLRTRQPLYLKLHINYQMWPHAYSFFSPPSPLSPPPPVPTYPRDPSPVSPRTWPHPPAVGSMATGPSPRRRRGSRRRNSFPSPRGGSCAPEQRRPRPCSLCRRSDRGGGGEEAERQGRRRRGGGATGAAARRRSLTVRSVLTRATPPPALELGRAEGSTRSELLFLAVASDTASASTKVGAALSSGGRALAEVLARRGCWGRLARAARRLQLSRICSGGHGGPTAPRLRDSKCGREALVVGCGSHEES